MLETVGFAGNFEGLGEAGRELANRRFRPLSHLTAGRKYTRRWHLRDRHSACSKARVLRNLVFGEMLRKLRRLGRRPGHSAGHSRRIASALRHFAAPVAARPSETVLETVPIDAVSPVVRRGGYGWMMELVGDGLTRPMDATLALVNQHRGPRRTPAATRCLRPRRLHILVASMVARLVQSRACASRGNEAGGLGHRHAAQPG